MNPTLCEVCEEYLYLALKKGLTDEVDYTSWPLGFADESVMENEANGTSALSRRSSVSGEECL